MYDDIAISAQEIKAETERMAACCCVSASWLSLLTFFRYVTAPAAPIGACEVICCLCAIYLPAGMLDAPHQHTTPRTVVRTPVLRFQEPTQEDHSTLTTRTYNSTYPRHRAMKQ